MNKLGTAVGGLLLIGALAAPVAFAHYDTGAHPVPYATTGLDIFLADDDNSCGQVAVPAPPPYNGFVGPNCGPGGVTGDVAPGTVFAANKDRVSGWYVGSTNTYTELRFAPPIANPGDPSSCPADVPETPVNENAVCVLATSDIDPSFLFAQWGGVFDAEVGGLGDCATTNLLNEGTVDGSTNGGGLVPDGVWNDGGQGAVGHTFGHYDCTSFETAGCDRYDQAFAEDLVSGEDIWIGAMCSWGTPVDSGTSPGIVDIILEFVGDVISCPLGGFPQSCIDAIQYLDDCLGLFLLQPNDTNCGGSTTTTVVCGAGNVSEIDFGRGQGSDGPSAVDASPWPLDTSATYPNAGTDGDGVNCDSVATASAFPFTAVIVSVTNGAVVVEELSVATYGWVA